MSRSGTTANACPTGGNITDGARGGGTRALFLVLACLAFAATGAANAAQTDQGGKRDGAHYTIAVHTSGIKDSREPKAIVEFVKHRIEAINAAGGCSEDG